MTETKLPFDRDKVEEKFTKMFGESLLDQYNSGLEQCEWCKGWFTKGAPHGCISSQRAVYK